MPSAPDPEVARLAAAVLMPGFSGARVPDWLARATEQGLGGVCLFAPNIGDDVAALTGELHGIRADVLIASDEEGGEVTRLEAGRGSSWPTHAALGRFDDAGTTRRIAAALGRRSRRAGIDLVLAPDVDVTSNPDNPVIGLRSFGADPELVARHSAAFVTGLQEAGVASCPKHFPGHGDTRTDSHVDLPVIDAGLERLRRRDLPPFVAAVAAGARAVMTAHIVFPALDGSAPATLSPTVLGMLRRELGFPGVVVSDAVDMKAISAGVGRGRGAALALAAGVDLVCVGNPSHPAPYDDEAAFHEVHGAVVEAVAAGRLSTARLEEAAARVAELARWVAVARPAEPGGPGQASRDPAVDGGQDALELARSVAREVLQAHGSPHVGTGSLHLLDLRGTPNLVAGPRPSCVVAALERRAAALVVHQADDGQDPAAAASDIVAEARQGSLVVLVDCPRRSPGRQRLLDGVLAARPDAVVVMTGLPDDRDRLGGHWVRSWGDCLPAGEAVAELLLG